MKKRSILTRIAVISVLMAIAAMLLGGVIFFALFRQRAVKNMEERLQSTINICCFQIYDYKTYMWLLDYWKEHGDEMEVLPYGGDQKRLEEWVYKTAYLFDTIPSRTSLEEVSAMPPERQKEFAEFCYTEIYRMLSYYRDIFNIETIRLFMPEEDGEKAFCFLIVDAKYAGMNYLDIERSLGTEAPFDLDQHPELKRVINQEAFISDVEFYRSDDGSEYASIYTPVGSNREFIGYLSLTQSMDHLLAGVWSDVLSCEKWIALIIAAAIFVLLLTLYLSSIRPTLKLQKEIRSYKETKNREMLNAQLSGLIKRKDEIGCLSDDVNEMACEIERYYQEIIRLTETKEQIKANLLLAQIKPHFIYNCLVAIRSRMDEPQKAEELLNHFAGVLRGCIDVLEEKNCIRAEKEFRTVEDYLFLEKERFGKSLTVVSELSDQDFYLPAFSVQMLVENAVNHGIRKNPGGSGTVRIKSFREEEVHVIEVEDDGPGLPEEMPDETDRSHIGLTNVKQRLETMCSGTLTITSRYGEGTLAVIRIPSAVTHSLPGD